MKLAQSIAFVVALSACDDRGASTPSSPSPAPGSAVRVLMVTATAGFRHEDGIAAARQVMTSLAATGEVALSTTEDVSSITATRLAGVDVLFFALTSGELPFTEEQKRDILRFVESGHGFMGVHSASDTLYGWPDYGRLVGAYFREHPWTQTATVTVADAAHPSTRNVPSRFSLLEEFYTFRENPQPPVQILLRLDPASVAASGDFPLAWAQAFGSGRTYYNALGHFPSTWQDARFQLQLRGAIRWAAGLER
jgi:type 1 glutamine amidotransferase